MILPLRTRARAKVNLDLRVLGRRADGYHELESLVAFAGIGDELTLDPGAPLSLSLGGPRAAELSVDDGNLVLRAARALEAARPGLRLGRFHLVKRLPVAAGIGGGSADAAAALRLLARLNGIAPAEPVLREVAAQVGADVPVCLDSRARLMAGIGERLGPVLRLPALFAVLVNPGVAVETAAVFRALGLSHGERLEHRTEKWESLFGESRCFEDAKDRHPASGRMRGDLAASRGEGSHAPADVLLRVLRSGNDLAAPACRVAPEIDEVLERLAALPGCRLARMSGSGATCFALFDDGAASAAAAQALARTRPEWWVKPTLLR